MTDGRPVSRPSHRVRATLLDQRLLYESPAYFMSQLRDARGEPLEVPPHQEAWCELVAREPRLVLLAPRDHGKSLALRVNLLWRVYRHGCDPATGLPRATPQGTFTALVFGGSWAQTEEFGVHLRELVLANVAILGPLVPASSPARKGQPLAWSRREVRFDSGASIIFRPFGTSARGFHPDVVILDDVLNDANTGSSEARDATWTYFVGTIVPMHPEHLIVVGTALHRDDLLHRLGKPAAGTAQSFEWRKYRALNLETGEALWPARHSVGELLRLRDLDPASFSREYQNDPRDDAASIFPGELTERAIAAGAGLTFAPRLEKAAGEIVVAGADLAISENARADFTVIIVVAYNPETGTRRVLTAERHRGLRLDGLVALLVDVTRRFDIAIGVIEDNGFQAWLLEALAGHPETRGRFMGHTTGRDKLSRSEGVLRLRSALLAGEWVMPSGDPEARRFARTWQAELAAYGWRDGRLEGVGEHDDTVIASWLVELAVRRAKELLAMIAGPEIVSAEDLGIERVRISPELDAADRAAGVRSPFEDWDR